MMNIMLVDLFPFFRYFQEFAESGNAGRGTQRAGPPCAHLFLGSGSLGYGQCIAQCHQRLSARNFRTQLRAARRQSALEPHPQAQL